MQFLIFAILALIISRVGVLIATPIVSKTLHINISSLMEILKGKIKHPNAKTFFVIFQAIQFFVLFLIPTLLFAYYADPNPQKFLGLDNFSQKNFSRYTIVLVVLAFFMMGFLAYLNQFIPISKAALELEKKQNEAVETLALAKNGTDLILSIILVGLFAAIGEELFFRAALQRILIQWTKNPWMGIIITAIIFSAIHMQFSGFLVRFGLGIVLGAIYWYSGSIWLSILFHFLFNSLGVMIAYLKPSTIKKDTPIDIPAWTIIVLGLASCTAIYFIIQNMKKDSTTNYAEVYPKQPNFFD
jgi:membrane protease YdiL (CAAX protease family)